MLIEKFIELSKNMTNQKEGNNKKCFLFDDYALLSGNFKKEELKKEIEISNKLAKDGVLVVPTLEYFLEKNKDNQGFCYGYILQPKAKGSELFDRNMTKEEFIKRFKEVNLMKEEDLDKFISDALAMLDAGLRFDSSKSGNFFFYKNKISFIDLNLRREYPASYSLLYEFWTILTGGGLKYKDFKVDDKLLIDELSINIFKKLFELFLKKKLLDDEVIDYITFNIKNFKVAGEINSLYHELHELKKNKDSVQIIDEKNENTFNNAAKNLQNKDITDDKTRNIETIEEWKGWDNDGW